MSTPMAAIRLAISLFCEQLFQPGLLDVEHLAPQRQDGLVDAVRPLSADPPAESPSTRNSSLSSRSRVVQSISLPGSPPPPRIFLRSISALRALPRRPAASADRTTFCTIFLASFGFSSRYFDSTSPTALATAPSTSGLLRRIFVWASKCGSGQGDVDDGGQPLAEVLAVGLDVVLVEVVLLGVGVEVAGEGLAEPGQVGAAVRVELVVGVAADPLVVARSCTGRRPRP